MEIGLHERSMVVLQSHLRMSLLGRHHLWDLMVEGAVTQKCLKLIPTCLAWILVPRKELLLLLLLLLLQMLMHLSPLPDKC
jgi:hypothetical protein